MPSEPRWLPIEVVIDVNRAEVEVTQEPHFLRDRGLLESACARAQNHWHYGEADVVRLAAAMMIGIAQNHAFEQGNKRTAITAAIMFIEINGYQWVMPNNEVLGLMVEAALLGRISEEKFAELVRPFVMPTND